LNPLALIPSFISKDHSMTSPLPSHPDLPVHASGTHHEPVFAAFAVLQTGQALELQTDHDPADLRSQFELRWPGGFHWTQQPVGAQQWTVRIARLKALAVPVAGDSCCSGGACCG
jgi:uncharacterized protein (DUF2249 family)